MATLQFKRGQGVNLPATGNPGEPFYDVDSHKLYVAGSDGVVRPITVDAHDLDGMGFDAVYYVSKVSGSASGTGAYTSPLASIQGALDKMGAPANLADFEKHYLIFVVDGAFYTENLTVGHRKVSITGAGFTIDGNVTMTTDETKAFGSLSPDAFLAIASSSPNADGRDARSLTTSGISITGDVTVNATAADTFGVSFLGVNAAASVTANQTGAFSAARSKFANVAGGVFKVARCEAVEVVSGLAVDSIDSMDDVEIAGAVTVPQGAGVLRHVDFAAASTGSIGGVTVAADASTIRTLTASAITTAGVEIVPLETGNGVGYDPATTGLPAQDVQKAIDELYVDTRTIDGGTF